MKKCRRDDCWNDAVDRGYCRRHANEVDAAEAEAAAEQEEWLSGHEQERIAVAQAEAQARQKSPVAALILGICVGYLGADRFYVGQPLLGLAKLLTCGGAGVWWIVDLFLVGGAVERANQASTAAAFHRQGLRY